MKEDVDSVGPGTAKVDVDDVAVFLGWELGIGV